MRVKRVSRLALPKGAKPKCELCAEPAEYKCTACLSWFCSVNHFRVAWEGVLHLIYRELNLLQETSNPVGSERERQEQDKMRKQVANAILNTSTSAAQTWVVQGNFKLAVAGALYAARTAEMLFGVDSTEIVPSQILLAEIYLGLQQLHSAEELLNMVYFTACEFGPTNFRIVPSFFNMAEVFKKKEDSVSRNACEALYCKICEIIMASFEHKLCGAAGDQFGQMLESMALCATGLIYAHVQELEKARDYTQKFSIVKAGIGTGYWSGGMCTLRFLCGQYTAGMLGNAFLFAPDFEA
ncbi:zinc finger MYND domain-containing protein 12-like [Cyclospora cayetanensis]|uniref:Zinc finger MYND domain-containing protein 12-like n=1 Tax=Cyclospora cayetanensis TaxID=88456 RepID=A0A6P6S0D6_9EIME|nr:zinc finger MYND domain-containing protein 12-like [Cyclospora cayetanensis]